MVPALPRFPRRFVVATAVLAWTAAPAAPQGSAASASTNQGGSGEQPNAGTLAWLSGCWQLDSGGRRVREHWMPPDGGTLFGMSRSVRDGAVAEFEFLRIEPREGRLHYVAKPSGQAEAAFALTEAGPDHATFEDPGHDFPQRIGYRRQGHDALLAWIEGTREGRTRRVEYPYQRVPCE